MAIHFVTDFDSRFIADNMLTPDDFSFGMDTELEPGFSTDSDPLCVQIPFTDDLPKAENILDTPPDTPPNNHSNTSCSPTTLNDIELIHGFSFNQQTVLQNQEPNPIIDTALRNTFDFHNVLNARPLLHEDYLSISQSATLPTSVPLVTLAPSIPLTTQANENEILANSSLNNNFNYESDKFTDPKSMKKYLRMIRNRESACQSRRKKKEHLECLEQKVQELVTENENLRRQNTFLRDRVADLEKQNNTMKNLLPKDVKKATCLLALIFMLTINIAPFSALLSSNSNADPLLLPKTQHNGRSLLWSVETEDSNNLNSLTSLQNLSESDINFNSSANNKNGSRCPTYINKTESLRLESELRGLVFHLEKGKEERKQEEVPVLKMGKPFLKFQNWFHYPGSNNDKEWDPIENTHLQVYQTAKKLYEAFYEAIHRRDDTFYFVSFSRDHMLLPADSQNRTHRPKMSLVMPVLKFNESTNQTSNQLTMMQIDCEVMNTEVLHIDQSHIPPHLREELHLPEMGKFNITVSARKRPVKGIKKKLSRPKKAIG